jgi:isopenicillin N synthase-like dioxygenase
MNGLGRRVARVLACALDLPANYFAAALREPSTYSQLFHYPSVAPERESASLGAGEHVDWGLLTILLQDDVGGLEVRTPDGRRHAVAPVPDAFVVILGELILRLTDGQFRSAPHRVARNTTGRSRYAMPTFIDPDYDAWIACVPTCQPADREPRYPACTLGAHMLEMARTTLSAGPRP